MQEIVYKFKNLNWTLVMSVLFLSLIGLIMIYSASNSEGMSSTYSHLAKLVFGFTVMFLVAFININTWQKYSFLFYLIGIIILIYATFYGFIGKGSRRWINFLGVNIQPSEIMKIFLIIGLAKFFDERKIEGLRDYLFLLIPIIMIAIPFLIILI